MEEATRFTEENSFPLDYFFSNEYTQSNEICPTMPDILLQEDFENTYEFENEADCCCEPFEYWHTPATEIPGDSPFYDPSDEMNMTKTGHLPHCHKDFTYQFVTYRLADSLPREHTSELRLRIKTFLEKHPLPWDNLTKILYSNLIGPMQERLLENGYGCCALKNPKYRKILIEAIHYKASIDYDLNGYVIMPNHVHMVIRPYKKKLSAIMKSIKGYSGIMINRAMRRHGDLWMKESFDRMPRHEKDLWRILRYIKDNPRNLPPDAYTLYFAPNFDPR